jgi:small subunit ribosomal protein S17e
VVNASESFLKEPEVGNHMGRIRTKFIKRNTKEIMDLYGDRFTDDFEKNKELLNEVIDVPSKKLRNKIAGYITKLKKQKKKVKKEPKVE